MYIQPIKTLLIAISISLLCEHTSCKNKDKKQSKTPIKMNETAELGQYHSFKITKYATPMQFNFMISCQRDALINFQLSPRLKLLHKNIFLDVQFQTSQCIIAHQDITRLILNNDDKWDLHLQMNSSCCTKKNANKVFNQSIIVQVRDGFKLFGISIKTKTWNIIMPIFISFLICLFVWFSNFSQPRANNVSFLTRFYQNNKGQLPGQKHMEMSIDKVQKNQNLQAKNKDQNINTQNDKKNQ